MNIIIFKNGSPHVCTFLITIEINFNDSIHIQDRPLCVKQCCEIQASHLYTVLCVDNCIVLRAKSNASQYDFVQTDSSMCIVPMTFRTKYYKI